MDDNCYKLVLIIIQLISVGSVVIAFIFDINVKRNIAKQSVIHDWYKILILPIIDNTINLYFNNSINIFDKYIENLNPIILLSEIRKIKNASIIEFHKNRHLVQVDFLGLFSIINKEASEYIGKELEKYEDESIALFEKASLNENNFKDDYLTITYKYRDATLKQIFISDGNTVIEIARTKIFNRNHSKK